MFKKSLVALTMLLSIVVHAQEMADADISV